MAEASPKCEVCFGPDGQQHDFIPALVNKFLGIVLSEVLSCDHCSQLFTLWDDFSAQATLNLNLKLNVIKDENLSEDFQKKEDPPSPYYEDVQEEQQYEKCLTKNLDSAESCHDDVTCSNNVIDPSSLPDVYSPVCDPPQQSVCDSSSSQYTPFRTSVFSDTPHQFSSCLSPCNNTPNISSCRSELSDPLQQEEIGSLPSDQINGFTCDYCDSKFMYKRSCLLHIKKRHQVAVTQVKCEPHWVQFENNSENTSDHYPVSKETIEQNYSDTLFVACLPNVDTEEMMDTNEHFETENSCSSNNEINGDDSFMTNDENTTDSIFNSFSLATDEEEIHNREESCSKSYSPIVKKKKWEKKSRTFLNNVICLVSGPSDCPKCSKKFRSNNLVYDHILRHHYVDSSITFNCIFCKKVCNSRSSLSYHISTHLSLKFQCKICKIVYASKQRLKIHHLYAHNSKIKSKIKPTHSKSPFINSTCSTCSKTFVRHKNFLKHVCNSANVKRDFICSFCDKHLASKQKIQFHIQSKHLRDDAAQQYKCSTCGKSFVRKKNFLKHVCAIANTKNDFYCYFCEKKFASKQSIRFHIQNQHLRQKTVFRKRGQEKHFTCPVCDRTMASAHSVRYHLASKHSVTTNPKSRATKHTHPIAPIICNLCGKELRSIISLKKHIVAYHSKWKKNRNSNYQCDMCQRWFSKKNQLVPHLRHHVN